MKKRVGRMINNLPIRIRFLVFFLLVAFLVIIVVTAFALNILSGVIKENSARSIDMVMEQALGQINNTFQSTERMMRMIAKGEQMQAVMKMNPEEAQNLSRSQTMNVSDEMMTLVSFVSHYTPGVYAIGKNGGQFKSTYSFFKEGIDFRQEDWFLEVLQKDDIVYFDKHAGSFVKKLEPNECFSIGMPIVDIKTGERLGVLLVDIMYDTVLKKINDYAMMENSHLYFMDEQGRQVMKEEDDNMPQELIKSILDNKGGGGSTGYYDNIGGHEYYIYCDNLENGWTFINSTPVSELTKGANQLVQTMIVIPVFIVIFGFLVATIFANTISRPLLHLSRLMRRAEKGDLDVRMNVLYTDEIGQLGKSFNTMLDKIEELIERVEFEQSSLRKAQLQVYQEQINPHFLYNTFDSINWLVRAGDKENAIIMVNALTKLLRTGLSRGRDVILIREEMEHAQNYFTIQKIRYSDKMVYEFDLPPQLELFLTPRLILQPIIENAIYHGIKNKRGVGAIFVGVAMEEDGIVYTVRDTGAGMTLEKLKKINDMLRAPIADHTYANFGFGIKNVNDRIRIMYGDRFGLYYSSVLGEGTTVRIVIPIIMEEDENA